MTVFDTRLDLTALDAIGPAESPAAQRIVESLLRRTAGAEDGYAARENLAHPPSDPDDVAEVQGAWSASRGNLWQRLADSVLIMTQTELKIR